MSERLEPKGGPKLPRYESVETLGKKFKERTEREDRKKNPEKYTGFEGGVLFLRYYSRYRNKFEDDEIPSRFRNRKSSTLGKPIHPWNVSNQLRSADAPEILIPVGRLRDIVRIRREVMNVDDSYNTEDGQIRWLIDHDMGHVPLLSFFNSIPSSIRARMKAWRKMPAIRADKAAKIYSLLSKADPQKIRDNYNTLDGRLRWLIDNGFEGTSLAIFRGVTPAGINKIMDRWKVHYATEEFDRAKRQLPAMEKIAKILREEYNFDDTSAEVRIARVLALTSRSNIHLKDILQKAHEYADKLLTELSLAKFIKDDQRDFNIQTMHDLYKFANERFSLEAEAVWVILRLKKMNLMGVTGLVRRGYRHGARNRSLDAKIGKGEPGDKTFGEIVGSEDSGFAQTEARLVLRKIAESGHLDEAQVKLLNKVIGGQELEENQQEALIRTIKTHPELMELLGVGEERGEE